MAYQYDELGNVIGEYESEEERRRREQANQPVKQTITYNPDGTQEMTIKGTPEALSPINPNTPTLTSSTDDTYKRMLQVESGNRNFTPSGQPVTSPKGAMFASQVMPSTAANPGYGVRPATSQTPEEYNRVGQEYYQALLKQFGGDAQKAAAAYNAGPGRVQQNIQQNQGQMNVSQLPKETQSYLQKIGGAVSNLIPSAQAGTLPQAPAPVKPTQLPPPDSVINNQVAQYEAKQPSMYSLGTGMGQPGLRAPQSTPTMVPDSSMYIQQYVGMQDDPQKLIQYGFSETVPEPLRNRAKSRAAELITQQQGQQEAQQRLSTMTETELAKAMREKTTGGSYLKAIMFGLLGMDNSAQAEAAKLGIGKEQSTMLADGTPAIIKVAANGTPISGYNATTGAKLSNSELIAAQAGGTLGKGASLSADVYVDQTTGQRYRSGFDNSGRAAMVNIQGGAPYRGDPKNLTLQTISTTQAKADIGLVTELKKKHGTNVLDAEKEYVALNGPFKSSADRNDFRQAYGFDLAGTSTTAPAKTTTTTGAGTTTTAVGSNVNVPLAQQQRQAQGQKDIVTEAAKQVAASPDTQNMLNSINKVTTLLDSGQHNVGSTLSAVAGRGPIAQAIGSQFETVDAKNTKTIMDTVNKLAADGLKTLGSNPSTVDLEFWTRFKPDASSDPQFVKEWIESRSEDLKRRLGYATSQMGAGGTAGTAPSVSNAPLGTAQNPIKIK